MWYERDAACARLNGPLPMPDPGSGSLTERIRVVTQDLADRFAAGIARHPEDWHMLQRMWREPGRNRDPGREGGGAARGGGLAGPVRPGRGGGETHARPGRGAAPAGDGGAGAPADPTP